MKKLLLTLCTTFSLIGTLLLATPVSAATPMSFTLTAGALSISTPTLNASLGSEVSSTTSSTIAGQIGTVTVTDQRGGVTTWTVSAIATAFTPTAGPADPASNVSYVAGTIAVSSTVVATALSASDLTGESTVVTGASTGISTASWNPTISVVVPANFAPGTYTATITQIGRLSPTLDMRRGFLVAVLVATCAGALFVQSAAWASSSDANGAPTLGIRLLAVAGTSPSSPLASSYIVARLAPGDVLSRTVEIDEMASSTAMNVEPVRGGGEVVVVGGQFEFAGRSASNDLDELDLRSQGARSSPESRFTLARYGNHAGAPGCVGGKSLCRGLGGDLGPAREWKRHHAREPGRRTHVRRGGAGRYVAAFKFRASRVECEARVFRAIPLLVTTVHNSGANTLDLNGHLTLTHGPGGLHAGPFVAKLGVILAPGASEPASVILAPDFPRGPWTATLNVSSGTLGDPRATRSRVPRPFSFLASAVKQGNATDRTVVGSHAPCRGRPLWLMHSRRRKFTRNTSGRAT